MKISDLSSIKRKIESLDAMIMDPSTTEGEKRNARSLKKKLEDKLPHLDDLNDLLNDPLAKLVMSYHEYEKKQDRYKNDPDLELKDNIKEIDRLRELRKSLRHQSALGDVEARRDIKDIDYRIESLMKRWMPKEYEKLVAKRKEARDRSYDTYNKKKIEKTKSEKKAMRDSGQKTASEISSEYKKALTEFTTNLKKVTKRASYMKPSFIISGISSQSIGIPAIREAFNACSEETKSDLIKAVKEMDTHSRFGITDKQKEKILKAFGDSVIRESESFGPDPISRFKLLIDKGFKLVGGDKYNLVFDNGDDKWTIRCSPRSYVYQIILKRNNRSNNILKKPDQISYETAVRMILNKSNMTKDEDPVITKWNKVENKYSTFIKDKSKVSTKDYITFIGGKKNPKVIYKDGCVEFVSDKLIPDPDGRKFYLNGRLRPRMVYRRIVIPAKEFIEMKNKEVLEILVDIGIASYV